MSGSTCATCRHLRDLIDCHRYPTSVRVYEDHGCGEHTPAEPVGVPVLPHPWRFATVPNGRTYASSSMTAGWCGIDEDGTLSASQAPPDVVDAVRAAHRARGVR